MERRLCSGADGSVGGAGGWPSIPLVDEQLPGVIYNWRYTSYLHEGRPRPFCYELLYEMR